MTSNTMQYLFSLRLLASGIALTLLVGCGGTGKTDPGKAAAEAAPAADTAQVFLLRTDTLKKVVELPGELIPYLQTELYAKVQGYVRDMKVDIGDRVRKGQTLAVIDAPEVNTQFAQSMAAQQAAKAKLTSSADNYNRLYKASQSPSPGIVAPVDLENSHNQMLADSAAYEALRQQSKAYKEVSGYLYLTAPYDGVITARKADPGALVNANSMLLTVQDNSNLRLRVAVPEIYVSAAGGNKNLSFSVDAYPERRWAGVLTRKTETIDPGTRTELWEFAVDNSQHLLKAGTFVYAKIALGRGAPSFVLPPSAIATTLERKFVIRVKGGKAQWVDVRQGMTTDAGVEVFGDLATGDTLLVKATDERKPGTGGYWKVK
ncbi:MAG TPA: efflux RND transporter periplasmic adaptor subunit [Puia sp.]|nr:efflux RND transporter periplasmic adaptor subunit [Puia sp.]